MQSLIDIRQSRTAARRYLKGMLRNAPLLKIFVYSKTGHSRRVAEHLGTRLGVAPSEITTARYTWPVLGWIAAGRDGMQGRAAPLEQPLDLPGRGLIVLVGPVWAGGPAAPLNTATDALKDGQQDVAALLTCGDPKQDAGPIDKMEARLGRPLKALLVLSNAAQDTSDGKARIDRFVAECIAQASAAS